MKRIVLAAIAGILIAPPGHAQERWCDSPDVFFSDSLPCHLEIISWVSVTHEGDHGEFFEPRLAEYERFIRMRLKNDLSMLSHESKRIGLWDKLIPSAAAKSDENYFKKRGSFVCRIWTVGKKEYPIAKYIYCSLTGYGRYQSVIYDSFGMEILGFNEKKNLDKSIRESLRGMVEDIATSYLDAKDKAIKPAPK